MQAETGSTENGRHRKDWSWCEQPRGSRGVDSVVVRRVGPEVLRHTAGVLRAHSAGQSWGSGSCGLGDHGGVVGNGFYYIKQTIVRPGRTT